MSSRTWTAKMKDKDIKITSEGLAKWRSFYSINSDLVSRISELMWFDMYVMDKEFGVSPHDIFVSVNELEAGEKLSGVKPATQFKKLPLKGLWHKHFFSANFVPGNILLALGKDGMEKLVNETFDAANSPIVTREMIAELAHRVTYEPLEKRDADGKLTGEWIIFIKNDDKNYYLCLNTHAAGDQCIYDRIINFCVQDFPELPKWLVSLSK